MCQLKKKKIIALIMAVTVFFMPMISIYETKQNVNIVHAEDMTVNKTFFQAVLALMGITAFMQGNMSSTFSIPETDLITLKDQFAQTLEADATKKAAWMNAQTDYLAGGVAKTMGAAELAKIGINDIYNNLLDYLKGKASETFDTSIVSGNYTITNNIINSNYTSYITAATSSGYSFSNPFYISTVQTNDLWSTYSILEKKITRNTDNVIVASLLFFTKENKTYCNASLFESISGSEQTYINDFINLCNHYNINYLLRYPSLVNYGNVIFNGTGNIINTSDTARSIMPTIPWLDPAIPAGTIVTPAIAAPYAGTVPIDVPITAPIDPPIDEPETPTFPDVLSATLAILAALTPISAILDNLDLGVGDLTDVIDQGNSAIEDGLDDIIGGITGLTTGILTSIENFFDPPSKDIDWDKLRNIQIFDKFPFSIPADLYFLLNLLASDPVAPKVAIDLNLSFISAGIKTYTYDLSQFDDIAQVMRGFELLGFIFFLLYSSKNLIWK